jgi:hypothetical protein
VTAPLLAVAADGGLPEPRSGNAWPGQGAIGEALASAELLRRGFSVARPLHDDGFDLVVYRGTRLVSVQVKTSAHQNAGGAWRFKLRRSGRGRSDLNSLADIWIFHALPVAGWWVAPRSVLDDRRHARAERPREDLCAGGAGGWGALDVYRDAWHVIDEALG